MKYLKKFATVSEYEAYMTSSDAILPNVSICEDEINVVHYNPNVASTPYLKFTAKNGKSSVCLTMLGSPEKISLQYRVNGGKWDDYQIDSDIPLANAGDYVEFYGENEHFSYNTKSCYNFLMDGRFDSTGSIMSLMGFSDACTEGCFSGLFQGCRGLETAPSLPATTLAIECYCAMFAFCTSLEIAPSILPATNLADNCYSSMFSGCQNLTTVPELPSTALANGCYSSMFLDCTSLTTAPKLPAAILANACYASMFKGCTSLTTAPSLTAGMLADACYMSMFEGCTRLVTAPELPATTLANGCYVSMFQSCTSLMVYSSSGAGHTNVWRIPTKGNATGSYTSQGNVFKDTMGNYANNSNIFFNTQITFYTQNAPV